MRGASDAARAPRRGGSSGNVFGDLFSFDTGRLAWASLGGAAAAALGQPPTARYGHGFTAARGELYVFGGVDADGEAVGRLPCCSHRHRWMTVRPVRGPVRGVGLV